MDTQKEARRPWGLAAFLLLAAVLFLALGIWQVQRMHWKHDLIARVNARVTAAPVTLPTPDALSRMHTDSYEYLRVEIAGQYRPAATALVRAATALGTGYWTMTLLETGEGRKVWINRGYLPSGTDLATARASAPEGPVRVIGLVRLSEPDGSLLQANRPADERWYSRDLAALSAARGAGPSEPVFIDVQEEMAERPATGEAPVPGLTVIQFPDNHLGYALTWFALCALSLFGIFLAWRRTGRSLA